MKSLDCIRTKFGDFIVRTEKAIVGRNPRTGVEIRTGGKYFYYFLPSSVFVEQLFGLKGVELADCLARNRNEELNRMGQRFGELSLPILPPEMVIELEVEQEIIAKLKTNGRIELRDSMGLFDGEMKTDQRFYPAIIFSAVGRLEET